jgi:outer membrane protein assembly factor BamA
MRNRLRTAVAGVAVIFGTTMAFAQEPPPLETTVETTADPAAQEPGVGRDGSFVDRLRAKGEEISAKTQIIERLNGDIDGWYPRLGGMTRGGGFAIGPGYRFHVTDDGIFVDLSAGMSIRGYRSADANVRWLQTFNDRFEFWTDYRYEYFPQEDFFGIGMDSSLDNRTSYRLSGHDVAARAIFKPVTWLSVGTRVGYLKPEIGPGTDSRYASLEELFTDFDAPGLLSQPDFMHTEFFTEADFRDRRGNPSSGGFYRASVGLIDDRGRGEFDHQRFDVLAAHYVPVAPNRRHIVSGRVGLSFVNNDPGERVPFYFLPYVGGVDTIRSFREFRFKEENAVWLGAEYRWVAFEHVSFVGFYDAGKVAHDWNDVNTSGLKKGYGFGFRLHSNSQNFARLDFGTGGGEGWRIFLKLGPSF